MSAAAADQLPPGPFGYSVTARQGEHEGRGHVYVTDAAGRKIASIWGTPDEKIALATLIIEARENTNATSG